MSPLTRNLPFALALFALLCSSSFPDELQAQDNQPPLNIVFFLVDDLGWTDINLTAPVFAGDTLYAESEVLGKRESKSRPTQGIVSAKTTAMKADKTIVMTYQRAFLVPKRGYAADD